MANPEHLEILKQGVMKWNQWRNEHPVVILDLSYVDLSGEYLRVADFSEAILNGADLSKTNLGQAILSGADLRNVNLNEADLNEANLSWAILPGAILTGATLNGADFSGADLTRANLSRADLSRAILNKARLVGANLSGANLIGVDLKDADLSKADLSGTSFSGAMLGGTSLSGVNLSGADLSGADLRGTDLSGADLKRAKLAGADLDGANLKRADFTEADLTGAILIKANLAGADLTGAKLAEAILIGAILTEAVLTKANLHGANLSEANLSEANLSRAGIIGASLSEAKLGGASLQDASLSVSRLINANFDGADLTGAHLWETQRAGWSIKGVICESVYWDEKKEKLDTFEPGDFERLYSEKARVQIKYPGGISTLEIATLPGLIQHLEALHPGTRLRFESIQDASGGALVNLVFDDADDISPGQIEELTTAIQLEAERGALQLRRALKEKEDLVLRLEGQVQTFQWTFRELLSQSKPNQLLIMGGVEMGDKYEISGQAGAVGPNAHAQDMTFNQIGSRIEQSMDLTALASELEILRQALKKEATTEQHDIVVADVVKAKKAAEAKDSSKVAESLKSVGKWAFDMASKIGASLAAEAIKQSIRIK